MPIVPGFVRVDVATFHTSAARVPKVVRERVPDDQTLRGILDARDVDAVNTVASVWELMVEMAEVSWELVLELTEAVPAVIFAPIFEANDEDALPTTLLVFVFTLAGIFTARDDDAAAITLAVFALTDEVMPEVCVLVFAFTAAVPAVIFAARFAARDVEATPTTFVVFALIFATNEVEAPATTVAVLALTAAFPVEIASARADEALLTAVFVFAFTPEVIPAVCEFVFALILVANEVDAVAITVFVFPFIEEIAVAT